MKMREMIREHIEGGSSGKTNKSPIVHAFCYTLEYESGDRKLANYTLEIVQIIISTLVYFWLKNVHFISHFTHTYLIFFLRHRVDCFWFNKRLI